MKKILFFTIFISILLFRCGPSYEYFESNDGSSEPKMMVLK